MSPRRSYYHAVITHPENCDECMQCLRPCPTSALRVRNGAPVILQDLCIDCGVCVAACPRKALVPDVATVKEMDNFAVKVAVPSPVLYAQFGLDCSLREIHLGLAKLGFDYIYDVFAACLTEAMAVQEHLSRPEASPKRPLISSMCPAVVRLVQVKYPTLVGHVLPFEPPRELCAREAKITLARRHGVDLKAVGAFYISPCPAKSVSVRQPAEKERSFLDGSIPIADVFVPLSKELKKLTAREIEAFPEERNVFGSGWERTGLMSSSLNIKTWIAVSGIEHVMAILDRIEEGKLDSVAFVEAHACMEGCVGGSLCVENIFVARSKILMLEAATRAVPPPDPAWARQLYDSGYFLWQRELKPRVKKGKAPSIAECILLMKKRDELAAKLPKLDCCACGSPSCLAFAEDVVAGAVGLYACPYLGAGLKGKQG